MFSYFLADAINENRITPIIFRQQIKVNEGGRGLNFKRVFTDAQLKSDSTNLILMVLGTTAIGVNKALDAVPKAGQHLTFKEAGKLFFQMLGVLAEFERSMIVKRVKAGLKRARAEGKCWVGLALVLR